MARLKSHAWDVVAWIFFAAVPVVIFYQAATNLAAQGVASGGPLDNAAIFPRIIAWILAGLAVVNILRILTGLVTAPSPLTTTPTTRLALTATLLFVAYLVALPFVGYHLLTPVLMAILMRLFGLGWTLSIVAAVGFSLGVAAVFEGLLNVVLPVGFAEIAVFG